MSRHATTVFVAVLVAVTSAGAIDLGLAFGTRAVAPMYGGYALAMQHGYGLHFFAELPFSKTFRVGVRGGQSGATYTVSTSESSESQYAISGFDTRAVFIAAAPVVENAVLVYGGVGAGYCSYRVDYDLSGENNLRVSLDGLVGSVSVGTRFRLSKLVSTGLEVEFPVLMQLRHKQSYSGSTVRFSTSQVGGLPPNLNVALFVTL